MSRLTKLLISILPYQQVKLLVPVTPKEVSQLLFSPTDFEVETQSFLGIRIAYKYKVDIKDDFIKIKGPFSNRTWPLLTEGKIQLNPNNGKAILQLTIRLGTGSTIQMLLALGIYFGTVIFMFTTHDVLLSLILPLVFQLVFIYGVLLYNFRYKAGMVLQFLNQTLKGE